MQTIINKQKIVTHVFDEMIYINATQLCKLENKKFNDWT